MQVNFCGKSLRRRGNKTFSQFLKQFPAFPTFKDYIVQGSRPFFPRPLPPVPCPPAPSAFCYLISGRLTESFFRSLAFGVTSAAATRNIPPAKYPGKLIFREKFARTICGSNFADAEGKVPTTAKSKLRKVARFFFPQIRKTLGRCGYYQNVRIPSSGMK